MFLFLWLFNKYRQYRSQKERASKQETHSSYNVKHRELKSSTVITHEYHHREDEKVFWKDSVRWSVATCIVAILAVIVAGLSLNDAHEALVAVQRAFILTKTDLDFMPTEAGTLTFRPVWENSGNTPTAYAEVETHCAIIGAGLQNPEELVAKDGAIVGQRVFAPHQFIGGVPCRFDKAQVASAVAETAAKTANIYLLYVARYRDVFNNHLHITERCDKVFSVTEVSPTNYALSSEPCIKHNCTDEQCNTN